MPMNNADQDQRFAKRSSSVWHHACPLRRRDFLNSASLSAVAMLTGPLSRAWCDEPFGNTDTKPINAQTAVPSSHWNTTALQKPFVLYSTLDRYTLESLANRMQGFTKEMEDVLELTFSVEEVKMVVLRDRLEYDAYLEDHFPKLPKRRALFVQHRGPGLVLSYLHEDWVVDARHECAHAVLHSCKTKLPSWIDEGLAEYFETQAPDRVGHREHVKGVLAQIRYGQVPVIDDLEQWHVDTALESKQYREAWSVVAFLLHYNPQSRAAFQQYLRDLQSGSAAGYLSRRLATDLRRNWRKEFLGFFQRRAG